MTPLEAKTAVLAALRQRYAAPEWALLEEVRDSTGYQRKRTSYADAVAMNTYPSRGMEIHGLEVKVSRGDFLRELKTPDKNAAIQQYCDRWWIVVSDATIVKPGDMPPTWGLFELRGKKLAIVVEAPKLEPVGLDRLFVAALLRNATQRVAAAATDEPSYQKGYGDAVQELAADKATATADLINLRQKVQKFEEATGVAIEAESFYRLGPIGEAVKRVVASDKATHQAAFRISACVAILEKELKDLHAAQAEVDALREPQREAS